MIYVETNHSFLIRIVENVSSRPGQTKTAFEVLVSEWGTMGRVRPTVGDLLLLCLQINALRAASYVNAKILGGKSKSRNAAAVVAL
jgi:hypothetical protein